jgi:hypothetical protein
VTYSEMEFKTGELDRVLSAEASAAPDALGQTALFYAVQRPSDEEAKIVAERLVTRFSIDPTRKDNGGQTPLFYAASAGNVETVKYLISLGCVANEADNLNQTPLFYASRDGRLDVALFLIDNGADVRHMDRNAQTPLFYAAREGKKELCELLISKGSLPEHVDLTGRQALYFAKLGGHSDLADWLASQCMQLDGSDRKRCRLVFVNPSDGSYSTPTVEQLEWIESKFPEICVWNRTGPIATSLAIPPLVSSRLSAPGPLKKKVVEPPAPKPVWMTLARQILSDLFKKEDAWIFLRPVDPVKDMCPDYFTVIKEPMDFGTIRRRMSKYTTKAEFLHDIELVFSNCKTYNKPGTLPDVLCTRVVSFWKDLLERYSFEQIPDSSTTPKKE